MRLWKKFSAMAAMAAMCVSLAVPATVRAEEVNARMGGCPGGCNEVLDTREEIVSTRTRPCPDCEEDCDCTVTIVKVILYEKCYDCGNMMTIGSHEEIRVVHSSNCEE